MVLKPVLLQGPSHGTEALCCVQGPSHGTEACAVTGPLDAAADGGLLGRQSRVHGVLRHKEGGTQDHREMAPASYRSVHNKAKFNFIFPRPREK